MSAGFSKRAVLRAGFGAVIAVLVFSAVEAYRIQAGLSRQHLEIYRRYVDQEHSLSTLRRNLWLAGNDVRDFFINGTPEQAETLRSQLDALKTEDEQTLDHMEHQFGRHEVVPGLRESLNEFWSMLDPVPSTMMNTSDAGKFEFLQRVVVPRRGELYSALLALTAADQEKLQESEGEFGETRRRAAERLLLMLGIGVLLSSLVARFSLRHAENLENQAHRQLVEMERTKHQLQQLSVRLLEIDEEGRRRLSRELHDEIGQSLALLQIEISHALAAAPPQPALLHDRLARSKDLAERTVQSIRHISLILRPALLDDLGLVPALQFQLEDFLRRSGIACEFVEDGVADRLPDHVKTCVYRVVQEALHNCEKHSGADRVRVAVRQLPDALLAEVYDNGRGFHSDSAALPATGAGLGLLGMRERATMVGGTLAVETGLGKGTRVSLRIPLVADGTTEPVPTPNEVIA